MYLTKMVRNFSNSLCSEDLFYNPQHWVVIYRMRKNITHASKQVDHGKLCMSESRGLLQ